MCTLRVTLMALLLVPQLAAGQVAANPDPPQPDCSLVVEGIVDPETLAAFTKRVQDYAAFRRTMQLHTNASNNTIFADAEGNIAYWHSDYIPRRSNQFNWFRPVDGSNPATAYHGLLTLAETPHLLNPPNGWLYNSNNWPWSAAGPYSPKRKDFPAYVDGGKEETPRGYHALRLLPGSDRDKDAEILALRHQLAVLRRQLGGQRVRFEPADRAWLAALLRHVP